MTTYIIPIESTLPSSSAALNPLVDPGSKELPRLTISCTWNDTASGNVPVSDHLCDPNHGAAQAIGDVGRSYLVGRRWIDMISNASKLGLDALKRLGDASKRGAEIGVCASERRDRIEFFYSVPTGRVSLLRGRIVCTKSVHGWPFSPFGDLACLAIRINISV